MTAVLGDRSLFPDLAPEAYLNHAAISPPSRAVVEAVTCTMGRAAELGVPAFMEAMEQRDALRATIATMVGAANADDVAFVANTTAGVTDVALCFPWRRGDRVVLTEGEFPANVTPWQRAAALFELEVAWLPKPTARAIDGWLAALDDELGRGARLVAISAVQFQTGLRMPLARIGEACREAGAQLFVDAIQACGVVPIDVVAEGVDYLACGSHKWLMGPEGLAFLYVAPSRAAELVPRVAGWTSHREAFRFLFEGAGHLRYDRPFVENARMVEGGMPNLIGAAGLKAAVDLIVGLGVDAVHAHVQGYLDALEPELVARGFSSRRASEASLRSGMLCVDPPSGVDVVALFEAIDAAKVACAIPDGALRFAPHWPNPTNEIGGVLAAIDEALAKAR
ncbi:MAG TPA: aminotransferase class V-fold PLP-dependent enzyme [Polyangiaceae bacterium]|nr:aminotransferase class V-fold PLP-dependent enzyme [Polyangiaceae bacterium]